MRSTIFLIIACIYTIVSGALHNPTFMAGFMLGGALLLKLDDIHKTMKEN